MTRDEALEHLRRRWQRLASSYRDQFPRFNNDDLVALEILVGNAGCLLDQADRLAQAEAEIKDRAEESIRLSIVHDDELARLRADLAAAREEQTSLNHIWAAKLTDAQRERDQARAEAARQAESARVWESVAASRQRTHDEAGEVLNLQVGRANEAVLQAEQARAEAEALYDAAFAVLGYFAGQPGSHRIPELKQLDSVLANYQKQQAAPAPPGEARQPGEEAGGG